jgi:hypothetical protein
MEKIIHVILFDLATTKKSMLVIICSFIVFGLYFAFSIGDVTVIPISMMLWVTMIAGLPFNIREKQGMDNLLITLPVNRRNIVRGRLLYTISCGVIGISISEIMICLLAGFAKIDFTMQEIILAFSCGILLFCFVISIQQPLYYRFTHSQAIQLSALFLYFIYVVGYQLYYINGDFYWNMNAVIKKLMSFPFTEFIFLIISVFMVMVSYQITFRIYDVKDL